MSHESSPLITALRDSLTQQRYTGVAIHNYCRNADYFLQHPSERGIGPCIALHDNTVRLNCESLLVTHTWLKALDYFLCGLLPPVLQRAFGFLVRFVGRRDRCPIHEINPDWEDDLFERLNW